jgi:accessory gene regulator B
MFSIEKLTNSIAGKISSELGLDNDRKEVIAYGTFALLQTLLSIILILLFGLLFNVLLEALIVSFAISILRKYSGGVHSSSPEICASLGTVIAIGLAGLILFVITPLINLRLAMILGLIAFAWSYYIMYKLAPVDSFAKPIKTQKKRERMRKGSILILVAYMVIVVFTFIMYLLNHEKRFLVFSMCIYVGTTWQAFTLTQAGHLTINKIDTFLNHIFNYIRRRK